MKVSKQLLAMAMVACLFTACKQTDFKKTKDGFPYKVFSSGSGEKIQPGNFVSYQRTDKLKDSVLQTTYGGQPMFMPIPKDSNGQSGSMAELVLGAHKGDSIQINQPVDSIIRKNPTAAQDPLLAKNKGQNIITIIKIVDVYKSQDEAYAAFEKMNIENFNKQPGIADQRKKDEALIEQFLKTGNIQTSRTPWGAYIQILTPGTGPKPKLGQFVMLRYTGKDMAGNVFDASAKHGGELLPLQVGAGRSIFGFEDAVKQLTKGTKAVIYIPSVIGYGERGTPMNPQTKQQDIKPNENLVFDVEVVDITDRAPETRSPQKADSTSK